MNKNLNLYEFERDKWSRIIDVRLGTIQIASIFTPVNYNWEFEEIRIHHDSIYWISLSDDGSNYPLKYVHELQNWLFITKKELEITL